jgi:hypothetical protein
MCRADNGQSWIIAPYVGVGVLMFGQRRGEIRSILGGDVQRFKKASFDAIDTDAYDKLGLHLEYDHDDRLQCIEAWGPCNIMYRGLHFLERKFDAVLDELTDAGITCRVDRDGCIVDEAGFALFVDGDIVKTVTVARRGYFDDQ